MTAILRSRLLDPVGIPINGPLVDLPEWMFQWRVVSTGSGAYIDRGLSVSASGIFGTGAASIEMNCRVCNDVPLTMSYAITGSATAGGSPGEIVFLQVTANGLIVNSVSNAPPSVSISGSHTLPPTNPNGNSIRLILTTNYVTPGGTTDLSVSLSRTS